MGIHDGAIIQASIQIGQYLNWNDMQTRTQTRQKHSKKQPVDSQAEDIQADNCQAETDNRSVSSSSSSSSDDEGEAENSQLSMTLSTSFNPAELKCRDEERATISQFIRDCVGTEGGENHRVLYVSGVPGVGKTVLTRQIVRGVRAGIKRDKAMFKYLNALSLPQPQRLYGAMLAEMYPRSRGKVRFSALALEQRMRQDKRTKIVVIDEVDFLLTKDQSVLYNLFEWANMPQTRLCLLIIANTMDFPERLMGKVSSRMGSRRLVFKPYNRHEVQQIVEERLADTTKFTKDAVNYACKKMSGFTSDVRKILDVLRCSVERKPAGRIEIDDVVQTWRAVCIEVGGSWQEKLPSFFRDILSGLKEEGGAATVGRICSRMSSTAKGRYEQSEIAEGLEALQEMGIVRLKQKKAYCLWSIEATLLKI